MAKPFTFFTRSNGIIYAQFSIPETGRYFQKSTGTKSVEEAEKIVLSWYVNGGVIPSHGNAKSESKKTVTTLEKKTFFEQLKVMDFSKDDATELVEILKKRKVILSAVIPETKESRGAEDFLSEFWNYDDSPYVKEKHLKGQSIHRDYCMMMNSRIRTYWHHYLDGRVLGSITRDDIKKIFNDENVTKFAPKTINSIVASLTIPMKWAYFNGLTDNNCFDGIMKCGGKSKKRSILSMEEAAAVFKVDWGNESAKLANALAMYTGMRQGEIAALQVKDIGVDRLYVRHSWRRRDGIKCCKNGEEREVAIAPSLRDALIEQASKNPYNEGMDGFVFFGTKPGQPTMPNYWLRYLHKALAKIGYKNPKEICFHAWRHLWCSRICDIIDDKRVVMTGSGHKTQVMLDHYAEHLERDNALARINSAEEKLFLPLLADVV